MSGVPAPGPRPEDGLSFRDISGEKEGAFFKKSASVIWNGKSYQISLSLTADVTDKTKLEALFKEHAMPLLQATDVITEKKGLGKEESLTYQVKEQKLLYKKAGAEETEYYNTSTIAEKRKELETLKLHPGKADDVAKIEKFLEVATQVDTIMSSFFKEATHSTTLSSTRASSSRAEVEPAGDLASGDKSLKKLVHEYHNLEDQEQSLDVVSSALTNKDSRTADQEEELAQTKASLLEIQKQKKVIREQLTNYVTTKCIVEKTVIDGNCCFDAVSKRTQGPTYTASQLRVEAVERLRFDSTKKAAIENLLIGETADLQTNLFRAEMAKYIIQKISALEIDKKSKNNLTQQLKDDFAGFMQKLCDPKTKPKDLLQLRNLLGIPKESTQEDAYIEAYCSYARIDPRDNTHAMYAQHLEVIAMAEFLKRPIVVFTSTSSGQEVIGKNPKIREGAPLIFGAELPGEPIFILYYGANHYFALKTT